MLKMLFAAAITIYFSMGTVCIAADGGIKNEAQISEEKRIYDLLSQAQDNSGIENSERMKLAFSGLALARSAKIDSLQIKAFIIIANLQTESDENQISLHYLDSALQIANIYKDNWNIGEIWYRKGVNYHRLGEPLIALEAFNESLRASRFSGNFKLEGSAYSMMGTIFRLNGLYDRAIEYIIKSKLNYEKANFTEGNAWAAYLLGRIYADLRLQETAMEYYREALQIYQQISAVDGNKNGLAICFEQIGILNIETGNFEEAQKNVEKTFEIYTEINSVYGLSIAYKNLARIDYAKGNYNHAEIKLKKALELNKEGSDFLSLPGIYEYLGLSVIGKGKFKEGIELMNKGLQQATVNNQKKIQLDIYSKLAEEYIRRNDLKNALVNRNEMIKIQDSLLLGAANIKMEQLQTILEIDEKNSQIAELEKQNEINSLLIKHHRISRNIMIAGIILASLISFTIYLFYKKLRRKNRELKEANAAKDKLFAIIGHDLRGPAGAHSSLLEHLNSNFGDFSSAELQDILHTLHKSSENINNLLENLFIWAQSQGAKIEYRPSGFQLADVIQNSINGLIQTAQNKEISIVPQVDEKLAVYADPDMVQVIVRNLLSNAIKFTDRSGIVHIKTECGKSDMILISVTDTGVGIEKENLARIFDISQGYRTKGTENEKSTGLGLLLVKDFVEKNKGKFFIESEKNKGTTVSFTLPVFKQPRFKKKRYNFC